MDHNAEDDALEAAMILAKLDAAQRAQLLAVARALAPVSPAQPKPERFAGTKRDPRTTSDG